MDELSKIIGTISLDDSKIPEAHIVQVFSSIKPYHTFADVKRYITKCKDFNAIIKARLIKYFRHAFVKNDTVFDCFDDYVRDLCVALPLTIQQKAGIEYEFCKFNQVRPRKHRS